MELNKLVEVLQEKLSEEINGVKVLLGGSYVLQQVYGVLDRPIDDIDIIISHPGYISIDEQRPLTNKVNSIIQGMFPLDTIRDTSQSYFGTTEGKNSDWLVNSKVKTIVGYATAEINFLMSKRSSYLDFNSRIKHEGIPVVPLMEILGAKGSYGRDKDKIDFYEIVSKILKADSGLDLPF